MVFLSGAEFLDMIIMTAAAGFIFMDSFRPQVSNDPVLAWKQSQSWSRRFFYSAGLVAPAIILHELGHKFVAMGFGFEATFHAAYTWLGIGVFLKLISFPFMIIVPAFVQILGQTTPLQSTLIAFAGPAVNLLLWIVALIVLKTQKLSEGKFRFWQYVKIINMFLFIFNMLPIPGFDGSKVFSGLWQMIV